MGRVWFMFLTAVLAALFVISEAAIIRLTCEISDGKCLLKNIFATEDDRFKEIRNEGYRDIIDFFDCHIHTLPPIPFIRKVKADAINLVRIEENTFSTISELDVSYNRLREISPKAFEWPKELRELDLSGNPTLKDFTFLRVLVGLRKLDMSEMKLELDLIDLYTFSEMEDLSKLDMSNNRIASIPVGMFAQLVGLTSLDLSHNSIGKIAAGALAIDGQGINFDLSYNNISIIENNAFMHASTINLRNNKLLGVGPYAFDNQTNLGTLILSGNVQLKNFDFLHNLPNLHTLEMSGMNFSFDGIPRNMFDDLAALTTLDLSHNRIRELPIGIFVELESLNFVNLRHNLITHVEFGAFSMRKYDLIDEIDLSYNEIEEMNFLVFVPLKYLKTLLLHGNKITYVNAKQLIRNKSLQNFGIQKNLVRCYDLVDLLGSLKLVLDQDEFISDQPNVDGIKCEP
ncbi:leucine-rich repeat-containing G-protein coupled receptor 5-like [Anopheles aquasalis]|uniref:leucine-rich repeat-containing G-protein coupled receptor 5-like n=1 Tax=Anopheles aquasalis TaxID=42839 RepID=UPI00215B521F|nr:leucine-rich repeat-containing G-protein coupled receptor 5-like [Anopheles aquasalis]